MPDRPPSYLSDPKGKVLSVSLLTVALVAAAVIGAATLLLRWCVGAWTYELGR